MSKINTESATPVDGAEPAQGRSRLLLMISLPLVLIALAAWYYLAGAGTVSTDNAYVRQDKVSVSADVSGRIAKVAVAENQQVAKGALLFEVEQATYRIALAQAEAALATARLDVSQLRTGLATKDVSIKGATEDVAFAQQDLARQQQLLREGFTTRARFDQASHALAQAREALAHATAETANAAAALGDASRPDGQHPLILAALAKRNRAALDLALTSVRAPADGTVSQTGRLQVGTVAAVGLPMLTIVRSGKPWIEANFKETDLRDMAVGQSAEIELDAYAKGVLHGRVASIGAGTGSEFSVLPAQNASGNWVKVTQRVPVRIELIETPKRELIAGLSAKVTVMTDK